MLSKSLILRLVLAYAAIGVAVAAMMSAVLAEGQRRLMISQLERQLDSVAGLMRVHLEEHFEDGRDVSRTSVDPQFLGQLLKHSEQSDLSATLLAPDGNVVADSRPNAAAMPAQAGSPEVDAALERGRGTAQRNLAESGLPALFVAHRLGSNAQQPVGVVRLTASLGGIERHITKLRRQVWLSVAGVSLLGLLAAWLLLRSIVGPLAGLSQAMQDMAVGGRSQRLFVARGDEVGRVTHQFNVMSSAIGRRIDELTSQCRQFEEGSERLTTVLSAMVEGVIAVDNQEKVLFANEAAQRLLDLPSHSIVGRPLWEAVRAPEIRDLVQATLAADDLSRVELDLRRTRSAVAVVATRLPGEPSPGAVLVFHDITELRRLENLRREFVSNVSHELKTPLTSIQAYAETLLEGALEDPQSNRTFVHRIEEQAERLHALILDLLRLARTESGEEVFEVDRIPLEPAVSACVSEHAALSVAKQITLKSVPPSQPLHVCADAGGLRTILDNLIENAINYTPAGGSVTVRWMIEKEIVAAAGKDGAAEGIVRIDVEDTGVGIPEEDQTRVFERFYRVDKARSRAVGGTGLGLSIVKHLAQTFGGSVELTSAPGRGSTFSVRLRRAVESEQPAPLHSTEPDKQS